MSSWGKKKKGKTKPKKKKNPKQTAGSNPKNLSVAIFEKIQHYPSDPPA